MLRTIAAIVATVCTACIAPAAAQENMTPNQKIALAKKLCEKNLYGNHYKCDCIVEYFALELSKNPSGHVFNILRETTDRHGKGCLNTEAIYASALAQCADEFPYTADEAMTRLGLRQYCHCFAEKALKVGKLSALMECKKVKKYAVPADSPLTE